MATFDDAITRGAYVRQLRRLTTGEKLAAFQQWADQCGYRDHTIEALREKPNRATMHAVARRAKESKLDGVAQHLKKIAEQHL